MSKFKIDGLEYESRKKDIATLIIALGPDKVIAAYKHNGLSTLHGIYQKVWFDRKNKDSHPSFVSGHSKRILPFQEDYEIYPCDSNDDHLQTMIKRAFYELLPESKSIDHNRDKSPSPN